MLKTKKLDLFTVLNTMLMLGLVFVTLYPFLYMINISLSSEYHVIRNEVSFWPKGFTLKWYRIVFSDSRLFIGYRNTIFYSVLGTVIALVCISTGGFALSQRNMICRNFIIKALIFTILFSGGMIPTYMVMKSLHLTNTIWAMMLPGTANAFHLLVFRTFFQGLPEDLFDAGRMDGLNEIQMFMYIVVPLSKAVFAAIGLFTAVSIWNNFYSALLYLRDENLFPLQSVLRKLVLQGTLAAERVSSTTTSSGEEGEGLIIISLKYATIMVSTLPILMVYPFLQKYFVKGMLIGSVKS